MKRGDVYWANLNPTYGAEQGGERPVVIIQNDIGNAHSGTVIIAPMTSQVKHGLPTHVDAGEKMVSGTIILLEQIRTVDKGRLGNFHCHLPDDVMENVDAAIKVSLGLNNKENTDESGGGGDVVTEQIMDKFEERLKRLEESMGIGYGHQKLLEMEVSKAVVKLLGDKNSEPYKEFSNKLFAELNSDVREYFRTNSRNNIPLAQFEEMVEYIQNWQPCTNTRLAIKKYSRVTMEKAS